MKANRNALRALVISELIDDLDTKIKIGRKIYYLHFDHVNATDLIYTIYVSRLPRDKYTFTKSDLSLMSLMDCKLEVRLITSKDTNTLLTEERLTQALRELYKTLKNK